MDVCGLRGMGRNKQGVSVINISEGDAIADVAKVDVEAKDESAETTTISEVQEKPVDQQPDQTGSGSAESSTNSNEEENPA